MGSTGGWNILPFSCMQSRDVATPELMYLYPGWSPASTIDKQVEINYVDTLYHITLVVAGLANICQHL